VTALTATTKGSNTSYISCSCSSSSCWEAHTGQCSGQTLPIFWSPEPVQTVGGTPWTLGQWIHLAQGLSTCYTAGMAGARTPARFELTTVLTAAVRRLLVAGLSPQEHDFDPRPVHRGFVVGNIFSGYFGFHLSVSLYRHFTLNSCTTDAIQSSQLTALQNKKTLTKIHVRASQGDTCLIARPLR
jgi:hypothetical protein